MSLTTPTGWCQCYGEGGHGRGRRPVLRLLPKDQWGVPSHCLHSSKVGPQLAHLQVQPVWPVAVPALFVALCLKFDLKMHPNRKLKLYHMVGCFGEHHVTFYFQGLAPLTDWWKCRLHHWACCHLPFTELDAACPASSALPCALHSDWCAGHCPGVGGAVCVPHWEAICECHVPCC